MADHFVGVSALFQDAAFEVYDCLRVVMLYALRYETSRGNRVRVAQRFEAWPTRTHVRGTG